MLSALLAASAGCCTSPAPKCRTSCADGGGTQPGDSGTCSDCDGGPIVGSDGGISTATSFTLTSQGGGGALPFTLGLAFGKGDVPTAFTFDLPSGQVEVKRRWNDGSVKHAIVSGHVDLAAGQPRTIQIIQRGAFTGGTSLTCSDIQAAAPAASVALGALGIVQLSPLLGSPVRTWLSGPEAVECHYRAAVGNDPTLRVEFQVRRYLGGRIFVRAVVENGYLDVPTADKSYAATVTIGGSIVFDSGGTLSHYAHTRWSAEGWIGGDPGVVPKHDTQALMRSRLVPNYWDVGAADAALDGASQTYVPMQNGDWTPSMGDTGYQPQIGLLPSWDARYFTSGGDPRALQAVLANAKSLGSYPIVWRDSADDLPVRPSARPTWTVDGANQGGETEWGAGPYVWDVAHHGSGGYLAYLLTGDYLYLETMQLQAATVYLVSSSANGAGTARALSGQTRGAAWSQRTIGQLAAIGPLDTVTQDYRALTAGQAALWDGVRQTLAQNPLGIVYSYELLGTGYGPGLIAPWMENFFAATYGHVSDLEPLADMSTWDRVRDFVAQFPVGLLGDASGYCFTHASAYNIKVADSATPVTGIYDSWAKVAQASYDGGACGTTLLGGSGGAPAVAATGFYGNLMPAIAYAVDHGNPGAAQAWSRFTGASNWSMVANSGFDAEPGWGIVPRGYGAGSGGSNGDAGLPDGGSGPVDGGNPDGSIGDAGYSDGGSGPVDGGCFAPTFDPDASYPSDGGLSSFEAFLENLPHDTWYELPGSSFLGAGVQPPLDAGVWGVDGPGAVIEAWSGAAWDGVDHELLVWGGGHTDYSGDEVYAFNLKSASWKRLTDPDPGPFTGDPLPDGQPDSRHTYDGLAFVPDRGLLFAFGGSVATSGYGTNVTWTFDPGSLRWTHVNPPAPPQLASSYSVTAIYDPATHLIFARGVDKLYAYDFTQNAWTLQDDLGYGADWQTEQNWADKRGVLDPKRHLFFALGGSRLLVWDLNQAIGAKGGPTSPNAAARVTSQWQTSNGNVIVSVSGSPGADYDSATDEIVAWSGGSPWALDLTTKIWTEKNGCGAPLSPGPTGTFGRMRYLPEVDAFILVNRADEDVFFYKR